MRTVSTGSAMTGDVDTGITASSRSIGAVTQRGELMDDLIKRQDAIDALYDDAPPEPHYPSWYVEKIRAIPKVCVDACDIFPEPQEQPSED